MKYRPDLQLEFLQLCSHLDLKDLVDVMTKENGKLRWLETLTGDENYKQHRRDLPKTWQTLAAYLQTCGADTIATTLRGGEGVLYEEIVRDVAGHFGVKTTNKNKVPEIELMVLGKILEKRVDKMTAEERAEFVKQAMGNEYSANNIAGLSAPALNALLQQLLRKGGFETFKMAVLVANGVMKWATGRGLTLAANAALTRALGIFTGPVGWAVTALLTVPMISGPAYSVTIPAVVQVAYLRLKLANEPLL